MKKFLILALIIIAIAFLSIFFFQKNYKIEKYGNNMSKSKNLETQILQINSYEAVAQITITSNKTENTYKIKQIGNKNRRFTQEILEPEIIAGTVLEYDGTNLMIKNTKLNINKIFESYRFISSSSLSLFSFISDYKESDDASFSENETEAIMETTVKLENIYIAKKVLRIDKFNGKPKSLEIYDSSQKILVYILYNEIEINEKPEDVLAFKQVDRNRGI